MIIWFSIGGFALSIGFITYMLYEARNETAQEALARQLVEAKE